MRYVITASDEARVRAAIATAELKTSGEVIVVVAHQSDDYLHVPIHIAAGAALCLPILWSLSSTWLSWPPPLPIGWIFSYQLLVFIAVAIFLSLPALRYLITPKRLMEKYAHRHAATQFLARNLHTTSERTGILIFVSLLERYCEIVADTAIAEKVSDAAWQQIVAEMLPIIRSGELGAGLVKGVERCGEHLARHFPPGTLTANELPDHLIVI